MNNSYNNLLITLNNNYVKYNPSSNNIKIIKILFQLLILTQENILLKR